MSQDLKKELFIDLLKEKQIIEYHMDAPYNTNIHPSYSENPFFIPEIAQFAKVFLRSENYKEKLSKEPRYIANIPANFYNRAELWSFLKINPYFILAIPPEEITPSMYSYAITKDLRLFAFLPEVLQTIEIVREVIKKEPLLLQYVREDLRVWYVCNIAIKQNWEAIKYTPITIVDEPLVETANSFEDAFLLDIIPSKFLNHEMYIKCIKLDPVKAVNFLFDTLLNREVDASQMVQALMIPALSPEFAFKNVSPRILGKPEKEVALVQLIKEKPEWIHLIEPCCVTDKMLIAAIERNEFPILTPLVWTPSKVSAAFNTNLRSIKVVPKERLETLGDDRIQYLFKIAHKEQWVHDLPNYFFNNTVITNPDCNQALLESRYPYSYILNNKGNINWNELLKFKASVDELLLIETKAPNTIAEQLFKSNIENYAVLTDEEKTLERSIEFFSTYPEYINLLPKKIKEDSSAYKILLNSNPLILEGMDQNTTFTLLK